MTQSNDSKYQDSDDEGKGGQGSLGGKNGEIDFRFNTFSAERDDLLSKAQIEKQLREHGHITEVSVREQRIKRRDRETQKKNPQVSQRQNGLHQRGSGYGQSQFPTHPKLDKAYFSGVNRNEQVSCLPNNQDKIQTNRDLTNELNLKHKPELQLRNAFKYTSPRPRPTPR